MSFADVLKRLLPSLGLLALALPASVFAVGQPCVTTSADEYDGRHYLYWSSPVTWAAADADCQARGAALVKIEDVNENSFLFTQNAFNYVWIGLNDLASEGVYVWTDDSAMGYQQFISGEPNDWAGAEDCGMLAPDGWFGNPHGWIDTSCGQTHAYVCEYDALTDDSPECAGGEICRYDANLGYKACKVDNCPGVYNPDQADTDGDGIGDACEPAIPTLSEWALIVGLIALVVFAVRRLRRLPYAAA
jgi:hypothetical protein